jgi:hypothetical protein
MTPAATNPANRRQIRRHGDWYVIYFIIMIVSFNILYSFSKKYDEYHILIVGNGMIFFGREKIG